jgi:hypothetical protein
MPLPLIFILPAGRSSPKSITYRDRFCHRAGAMAPPTARRRLRCRSGKLGSAGASPRRFSQATPSRPPARTDPSGYLTAVAKKIGSVDSPA